MSDKLSGFILFAFLFAMILSHMVSTNYDLHKLHLRIEKLEAVQSKEMKP